MVRLKTSEEIGLMREAGRLVAACHREIAGLIRPGRTTWEIEEFVDGFLAAHGARAATKGYKGYRYATCASVNDAICHGFPDRRRLAEGDLVTIDLVADLDGWLADSAWSYGVGRLGEDAERLLQVSWAALFKGIEQARPGNRIGDISHAVQTWVEGLGYGIVREFGGHGVGRSLHEDPWVPHHGPRGRGARIEEGMVFTIEPMVTNGSPELMMDPNGWTARTQDGSLCAQFEHTIAILADGPLILTEL